MTPAALPLSEAAAAAGDSCRQTVLPVMRMRSSAPTPVTAAGSCTARGGSARRARSAEAAAEAAPGSRGRHARASLR